MGSHPTLDHEDLAAEALELDPVDWRHSHTVAHLAADHPQVRAWPDDNPDLAHKLDHRDWNYDHPHPTLERAAEEAFDRLNDPNPHVWQADQDYRMADAIQAARTQPTHTRRGPERVGPER